MFSIKQFCKQKKKPFTLMRFCALLLFWYHALRTCGVHFLRFPTWKLVLHNLIQFFPPVMMNTCSLGRDRGGVSGQPEVCQMWCQNVTGRKLVTVWWGGTNLVGSAWEPVVSSWICPCFNGLDGSLTVHRSKHWHGRQPCWGHKSPWGQKEA